MQKNCSFKEKKVGSINEKSTPAAILANRLAIIKSALESGISVAAHKEIVARLATDADFASKLKRLKDYTKASYPLACYAYGSAKLHALPHPAGRIGYQTLEAALGKKIRAEE